MTEADFLAAYERRRGAAGRSSCLTPDDLVKAIGGDVSRVERQRVAEHLTVCRDCAEEYRVAMEVRAFAERETGVWPDRAAMRWPVVAWAVAAALLIAVAGLGMWASSLRAQNQLLSARLREAAGRERAVASSPQGATTTDRSDTGLRANDSEKQVAELRDTVARLDTPQPNIAIFELEADLRRGAARAATTIALRSGASRFVLLLNITDAKAYSDYSLRVLDKGGTTVWSGDGLTRSLENTFTVALPQRLFPPGTYELKLQGADAGRRDLLATYAVKVVPR